MRPWDCVAHASFLLSWLALASCVSLSFVYEWRHPSQKAGGPATSATKVWSLPIRQSQGGQHHLARNNQIGKLWVGGCAADGGGGRGYTVMYFMNSNNKRTENRVKVKNELNELFERGAQLSFLLFFSSA